jgi:DNA-binding transcriptional regulator GbsR (MarR family)
MILPNPSHSHTDALVPEAFKEVPEELKQRNCWMGTKLKRRPDGKLDKPPYRVRAGLPVIKADKTDPQNRASFDEAYDALSRSLVDAIGFVFTQKDSFTVVDRDDVIDPETGEIDKEAGSILDSFDTYAEISVSGTGLHIICEAEKPVGRCKTGNTEIYDGRPGARFMVITGNRLGACTEIRECQDSVNELYYSLFPDVENANSEKQRTPARALPQLEELLEKARAFPRMGAKFRKLFDRGDISDYNSASDADYALMTMLIFLCAGDRETVIEAFKQSALYRPPPEKHRRYVELSVNNALASYSGSYYRPKALREKSTPEQRDVLTPYLALLLDASWWKGQKAAAAYKAYAALVLAAVENGIATDAEELRVGADVRSLAERAGLSRESLGRSSLPYLTKDLKLITWKRGAGNRAGEFILRKPKLTADVTIKVSTQYFNGDAYGDGLFALAQLIRMRTGASRTGRVTHLGEMQKVARLGMVAMFCMITLTASPRGLTAEELVGRTGRRRDHVLNAMRKLSDRNIVKEPRKGFFTFVQGYWSAYEEELRKSLIVESERRQRKQHQKERWNNEQKLKEGRAECHAQRDEKVISLDAERRRKLDKEAAFNQPTDDRHLTEEQKVQREECAMMQKYDRMVERCMDRLGAVFDTRDGGVLEPEGAP